MATLALGLFTAEDGEQGRGREAGMHLCVSVRVSVCMPVCACVCTHARTCVHVIELERDESRTRHFCRN